jgi:DNA-binding NtrC family response regulator
MSVSILVVDDEKEVRDLLMKFLMEEGYSVTGAASGKAAIQAVKTKRPDLVLLDLKMSGLDGIQTMKRLREIDRDLIVMLLTGYGTLQTAREAMKLGALDYVTKPFNPAFLKAVIQDALAEKVLG